MRRWLFIDTSDRSIVRIGSLQEEGDCHEWKTEGLRQSVLLRIQEHVSPEELAHVLGICVVRGPGSFSSVRAGVLIANLFARLYNIPLYGVSVEEARDLFVLRDALAAHTIPSVDYVAPEYDAEPNITCKPLSV